MTSDITVLYAFLVGLLGSAHCAGMCGGIVGALALGAPAASLGRRLLVLILYNLGRIASYALAGALAGGLSARLLDLLSPAAAALAARLLGGAFLILLGLYLAGWWPVLGVLERWGGLLWRRIEPLGRRLLPVRRPAQALAVGMLWGWLPCGMVYSALAMALVSGSAAQGAALMAAFGLGTLPMLLAMGVTAERLNRLVRNAVVRQVAGALLISSGLYVLAAPLTGQAEAPAAAVHQH